MSALCTATNKYLVLKQKIIPLGYFHSAKMTGEFTSTTKSIPVHVQFEIINYRLHLEEIRSKSLSNYP